MTPTPLPIGTDLGDADDEPLVLPAGWTPPERPAPPVLASAVPVVGAVVLWAVTGSLLALTLAVLGPLIVLATMLDTARTTRRARRRAGERTAAAHARVSSAISERHERERARRWLRHPDVAGFVRRDSEVWRAVAGRAGVLVVGAGAGESVLRVTGGEGDPAAASLRSRAATLDDAPLTVPAGSGLAVTGRAVMVEAVARALLLQLCLASPPGALRVAAALGAEDAWIDLLPHRHVPAGTSVALVPAGEPLPTDVDILIVRMRPGDPTPPGCGAVLTVIAPRDAVLDVDGHRHGVTVEAVARDQVEAIASMLRRRAERALGSPVVAAEPLMLADLLPASGDARAGQLAAVVGAGGSGPFSLDLVVDGPHAIVAGVTGAGKSELLVTWVRALCAAYSPQDVSFLLADFKGGTAFDALADLPHVTGVITDLDGSGARRAIDSLRAEIRWREAQLVGVGARDVADPRAEIPRLVVVVDEFAALVSDHPELQSVFVDLAARGRALGMHLILGTQRSAGVIRDSLMANCPLRVSLRVGDAADSRAVIGSDDAASIPGGANGRGIAFVRRAADTRPHRVRIALSSPADVPPARAGDDPGPRRPWLPELPARVELADLLGDTASAPGALVVGLADDPARQRQTAVAMRVDDRGVLVAGASGSGRSTVLRTIAQQAPAAVWVPADPEGAWDAVAALAARTPPRGTVVVIDDLDSLALRLPPDYAHELLERIERLVRSAGDAGLLVGASVQRIAGQSARIADLLPRRVLLAMSSRAEHIAAGGEPGGFVPGGPPGRARLDGREVQIALGAPRRTRRPSVPAAWTPRGAVTGVVSRRTPALRAARAHWLAAGVAVTTVDDYAAAPTGAGPDPVVVVGDPDEWQRHWRLLSSVRGDHALIIDASCAPEYRMLTGDRALPPYILPGCGRAWLISAGGEPERIRLSGDDAPAPGRHFDPAVPES